MILFAASSELVPEIAEASDGRKKVAILLGMGVGVGAMLAVRRRSNPARGRPTFATLLGDEASVLADLLVDGVILGLVGSEKPSSSLALSVAIDDLFLLWSVTNRLKKRGATVASTVGFGVVAGGVFWGGHLFADKVIRRLDAHFLPTGNELVSNGFKAAGAIILLWIVMQDLTPPGDGGGRDRPLFVYLGLLLALGFKWGA